MLTRRHNAQNKQAVYVSTAMLMGALGFGALQNGVNQQVHADKVKANQKVQQKKLNQKAKAKDTAIASGKATKVVKQTQKEVNVEKLAQVDKEVKAGKAKAEKHQKAEAKKVYQINHRVKAGETLKALAEHYHTKVSNIQYLNDLEDPTDIAVGQYIKIRVNDNTEGHKSAKLIAKEKATAKAKEAQAKAQADAQKAQAKAQQQQQEASSSTDDTDTNDDDDSSSTASSSSSHVGLSDAEYAAREWIANKESGGSYTARNGNFIGRYQMSASYLNGDYSQANQDKVANAYVNSRYHGWVGAQQFWMAHGWY